MPPALPTIILDAHEDIAWNALEKGRDPLTSAIAGRPAETANGVAAAAGVRTTGLPEWLSGRVGLVGVTIFVPPARSYSSIPSRNSYNTPDEAYTLGKKQLDYYNYLPGRSDHLRLLRTTADLDAVLASWQNPAQTGIVGLLPLMEGADPIRDPGELPEWYAAGLRSIGPAWIGTRYTGGTGEPGPLTEPGRRLLNEMAKLSLILDLSHLSPPACLEALDLYAGPLLASHSNPFLFLPTDRALTDEAIRKLAARDGVMGILPVASLLIPGWKKGDPRPSISKTVEAIEYVAQLTGSARCIGLGSDFDGGWGVEVLPAEMDSVADLGKVGLALSQRGWKDADIRGVLAENFLRVWRKGLPVK